MPALQSRNLAKPQKGNLICQRTRAKDSRSAESQQMYSRHTPVPLDALPHTRTHQSRARPRKILQATYLQLSGRLPVGAAQHRETLFAEDSAIYASLS